MRKLTYFVPSTIDGYIAGPDRGDPSGAGWLSVHEREHVDAIFTDYPDILPASVGKTFGIDPAGEAF